MGMVIAWVCGSGVARAGVWLTLAAGAPGSSTATQSQEFWFDTPHGPPVVAISQLAGGLTAETGTAGGTAFFGGAATPVLLNLGDGSAYIAGGSPPPDAISKGAGSGPRASAAPDATATSTPSDASLLGITVADPDAAGNRELTANVTDADGNVLGTGQVTVPTDGWWVIGLGPKDGTLPPVDPPPPPPVDPPVEPPVDPPLPPVDPPNPPSPPTPPSPGPVATPEPSTLVLLGIGGAVGAWRQRRRK
ncbi:MAG TPA: PEP-CTERM sorting domain-containing protein [Gemmataceae bacterium]|nr:PEP-CTERM sorting domain-containing protein [Gemmataceae bacterium]